MATRDEFSAFDADVERVPEEQIAQVAQKSKAPDDIEALREEVRAGNEARDQAIRSMLQGVQQQQPAPVETPPESDEEFIKRHLPADADEDVVALLAPVLRAQKDLIERDVAERFGPAVEAIERTENLKVIGQRVEGFSNDLLPEVKALYDSLPEAEQEEYNNRVGFEALTLRYLQSKRGQSDMSGMAHSADPATPPTRDPGAGPTEADVWAMPEDQFEALVHKVKTRPR